MNYTGFDNWIEIFRGGNQTDSKGNVYNGDILIDKAIETFDPSYHEPPLTIGHPKDNAPAYGWVSALKTGIKNGVKSLYAKFKNVPKEIESAASTFWKKRSASFYKDGRLRHVGLLGSIPPAVKGLADIEFSEEDNNIVFEFSEQKNPGEELELKIQEILVREKQFAEEETENKPTLTYREAFNIAMQENPKLTGEYLESIGLNY